MISLKLDKSSVSNGKSNSQRNNACDQTSPVSDDDTFVDGIGSEGGHGGGESSNGGGLLGLELIDGFRSVAHRKSNILARGVDRSESRNNGSGGNQEKSDLLEGLHCGILYILAGGRMKFCKQRKERHYLLVILVTVKAMIVVHVHHFSIFRRSLFGRSKSQPFTTDRCLLLYHR